MNDKILQFQMACNEAGIRDENGNALVEDGVAGEGGHTWWVIQNKIWIHYWQTGVMVTWLQNQLIFLGYNEGFYEADGGFGYKTLASVKAFQADCGLVQDGSCGAETTFHLLGLK